MEVSVQLHAPAAFTSRKKQRHALYGSRGGTLSRSGRCGEDRIFVPARIRALDRPARNLVYTPASLSRLPQHGKAKHYLYNPIQAHKFPGG